MIASLVDGRIRIRDSQLRKTSVVEAIRENLLANPGIGEVAANLRIGSLLIIYDRAATNIDKILNILKQYLNLDENYQAPAISRASVPNLTLPQLSLNKRKMVKVGMLTSLSVSMIGAILDIEKLHVASGVIFMSLLLGGHLYEKRRFLFT